MRKFRTRLTVIFILLIGFSVLSSGIIMVQMVEKSHLETLEASLLREMRTIADTIEWPKGETAEARIERFTLLAERMKALNRERITFIGPDGTVVGDSDHSPYTMDNHASREEIKLARQEGVGYSIRHSETIDRDLLYAAIRLPMEGGEPEGYLRIAVSLEEVNATTNRLWTLLMLGLLGYFLIAGLISYRIARGLTKPLERAAEVANQIAKHNYSARVHINGKDEFNQLADALNVMADSLQQQMKKIRESEDRLKNVIDNLISGVMLIDQSGTVRLMNRTAEDLLGYPAAELLGRKFDEASTQSELYRLTQECLERGELVHDDLLVYYPEERVLETNVVPISDNGGSAGMVILLHDITAVRRLERMRSEFVANVSHELRTPITAVKGFAETLLSGALEDEETARSFLQIIYDESDRINRLIEDTLALSRIESKRAPLQLAPIHLEAFADQTVEMVRGEARRRGITIEQKVEGELFIEADEDRLRQILLNLLSNAINFTPENGHVSIAIELLRPGEERAEMREEEKVRITVKDTGIGIPRKDLPRIFERFYRVDKARSRSSGGTGLGLSIVKHLVELHHGTIRVESTVGIGTSFIIELPVIHSY